jgi:sugar phosphate isomerase/epimerase
MFKNLSPGAVGLGGPPAEIMPLAKSVGFEGMDPALGGLPEDIKRLFDEHGMQMGCMGYPVEFRAEEEKYEQGMTGLEAMAKNAAAVGCTRCATWLRPASDTLTYEENFKLHADRLRPGAEVLREYGIRFGLEFVAPKTSRTGAKYEFIHTLDQVLDLCEAIGTGNMGVLLDAWHWYTAHGTLEDLKKLDNELVVQVHINDAPAGIEIDEQLDNIRALPGETGVIDTAGFLAHLRGIGYDGPVTPEPFCKALSEMPREEAAKTIGAAMDKIWAL